MDPVEFEVRGTTAVITLQRSEVRNCVDGETAAALAEAFRRFEREEALSVAILTGSGGCFCAGADLKAIGKGGGNALTLRGDGPMGPTRMLLSKPVLAAIEGYAVAGGLELALWCDLRVAARDAIFGVYCRRWGVPLVDGGTVRLPRVVGQSVALDMILTGRSVTGEEAQRVGLANRLVEPGESLAEAMALAETLARFPQNCLRADRYSALSQWSLDLNTALLEETRRGQEVIRSGETRAGATRFADGAGRHGHFSD